jgi:hypothetical protein
VVGFVKHARLLVAGIVPQHRRLDVLTQAIDLPVKACK